MLSTIIGFLAMLNPFALFLYLEPLMEQMSHRDFMKLLLKSTLTSYFILFLFLITGDIIFQKILQINFESFRIFGGIIIFSFAYLYIVKGQKAIVQMKGNLDELATEIAFPFMIGAGSISLTIVMGQKLTTTDGTISLAIILFVNYAIIIALKLSRDNIAKKRLKDAFDKSMGIILRLNGFFIGAIGVDMMVTGIRNVFF
ncbi:MAG: MarC family protein [archaeon]